MLRFGVNLIKYEVFLLNLQFAERSYHLRRASQLAQLDYGQTTEELERKQTRGLITTSMTTWNWIVTLRVP